MNDVAETRLAAAAAIQRSIELMAAAARLCRESRASLLASRAHLLYLRLDGQVDGSPVSAIVRTDSSIVADTALLQRAQLVMALGETFDDGRVAASLSAGPLPAALTLLRACDRVNVLEMAIRCPPSVTSAIPAPHRPQVLSLPAA
jgi:hypothetical protein